MIQPSSEPSSHNRMSPCLIFFFIFDAQNAASFGHVKPAFYARMRNKEEEIPTI
jgi:hypothetical protein